MEWLGELSRGGGHMAASKWAAPWGGWAVDSRARGNLLPALCFSLLHPHHCRTPHTSLVLARCRLCTPVSPVCVD
jgi:hypothetical protein